MMAEPSLRKNGMRGKYLIALCFLVGSAAYTYVYNTRYPIISRRDVYSICLHNWFYGARTPLSWGWEEDSMYNVKEERSRVAVLVCISYVQSAVEEEEKAKGIQQTSDNRGSTF